LHRAPRPDPSRAPTRRIERAGAPNDPTAGAHRMIVNLHVLQPAVALIAGILILVMPRLLNLIVAVYLILQGIVGLWPHLLR
jgi:hypothetical protein